MLIIHIKHFDKLNTEELYELLKLRSEVFVVEQDCVYQDLDGKDPIAYHIMGYHDGKLVAYSRVFKAGYYFKDASIGRVVVAQEFRGYKYGYEIMKASITYIEKEFKDSQIKISAQTYLKRFYNNLGFIEVGEGYLEDGIPHIGMMRRSQLDFN